MKGVFNQVQDSKKIVYKPLETMEDFNNLLKSMEEYDVVYQKEQHIKAKKLNDNVKALKTKAKELGKEIPTDLLVAVISGQPQGSKFFERNKEWFE